MKRFLFPLQPLRTLREQEEQAAQRRYAEARRAVEAAAQRVQATLAELDSCWSWMREQMTDGAFAERLDRTRAYCVVLDERRQEQEAALAREKERLHEAWLSMMLATRDREVLDRYFEKSRRAYDREVQREEQKILDEVGTRLVSVAEVAGGFANARLECA